LCSLHAAALSLLYTDHAKSLIEDDAKRIRKKGSAVHNTLA